MKKDIEVVAGIAKESFMCAQAHKLYNGVVKLHIELWSHEWIREGGNIKDTETLLSERRATKALS